MKGIVGYIIIYCYISIFFQVNPELQKPKLVIRWFFDRGRSKWLNAKGLETYLLLITDSHKEYSATPLATTSFKDIVQ